LADGSLPQTGTGGSRRPRNAGGDGPRALADPITTVPGVGPKRAQDLAKLGITRVGDILTLWPRRYIDRQHITPIWQLMAGETATAKGRIQDARVVVTARQRSVFRITLDDGTGRLEVTFFHAAWLRRQLVPGLSLLVTGRVEAFHHRLSMVHPEFEVLEEGREPLLGLIPVYPLAGDLRQRFLQELTRQWVPRLVPQIPDPIPMTIRQTERLPDRHWAVKTIHFPPDSKALEEARRRLVFDEFLRIALAVLWLAKPDGVVKGPQLHADNPLVARFLHALPFELTAGQKRAWADIQQDLTGPDPMARLLQGDVGSGKTVLAALTLVTAVGSGWQAALMAPTELLAEQHYLVLRRLLEPLGIPVVLRTGRQAKDPSLTELMAGLTPLIVVGTQALVSDGVHFGRLGAVVIDEQHRFGVRQRARLGEKGLMPHMLVMTATPIPRTLALTVYGDLQLSRIEGKPPGRQPVTTVHLPMSQRRQAYQAVRDAVRRGEQAYVVCPLVEDNEEGQGKAAVQLADGMKQVPGWRVGVIHGKMSAEEKSSVMDDFRHHRLDVLVGTTILEVGVDVPNATMIVIEEADRFGLAQLHQLRGRVGRGVKPSTCYLLADPKTEEGAARLQAMVETDDGLTLAERDLELRGPGEILGMRQHGLSGFQLANPLKDLAWLERAREVARQLIAEDSRLARPEHQALRQWVFEALSEALPGQVLH